MDGGRDGSRSASSVPVHRSRCRSDAHRNACPSWSALTIRSSDIAVTVRRTPPAGRRGTAAPPAAPGRRGRRSAARPTVVAPAPRAATPAARPRRPRRRRGRRGPRARGGARRRPRPRSRVRARWRGWPSPPSPRRAARGEDERHGRAGYAFLCRHAPSGPVGAARGAGALGGAPGAAVVRHSRRPVRRPRNGARVRSVAATNATYAKS